MKIKKLIEFLIFLSIFFIYGCQAIMHGTAKDFNNLRIGMTTAQVISILGEPSSIGVDSTNNTEKLYYRKMAKVTDWEPMSYEIVIKDGKVIKFGEASK